MRRKKEINMENGTRIFLEQGETGRYFCDIETDTHNIHISKEDISDFLAAIKHYPAAVKAACELFYQDIMDCFVESDRFVLRCLLSTAEKHLDEIQDALDKAVDDNEDEDMHEKLNITTAQMHGHIIRNGRLV